MSLRGHRRRFNPLYHQCLRKQNYATWDEAEAAAIKLTEDLRDGLLPFNKKGPVQAYKCDWAEHFHIGHDRKRPRNG